MSFVLSLTTAATPCRGDLLAALRQLDEEEDVNKVLRYFSYEHFYVIYCKVSSPSPSLQQPCLKERCLCCALQAGYRH